MIRIQNENELLSAFRDLDRDEVILPDGPGALPFPIDIKDYFTWTEPSGYRVFLVISPRERGRPPLGIVFRRDQSAGSPPMMCEFCHCVRSGSAVGMLTAISASNRRVGINACRDLSCREKAQQPPGINDVPEFLTGRERVWKVVERMSDFARQQLF